MLIYLQKLKINSKEKLTEIKTKKSLKTHRYSSINNKGLFKRAVTVTKLKEAWNQLKNNSEIIHKKLETDNINNFWFENTSQTLINGKFIYPAARKINISKNDAESKLLSIINSRVKIIEKALLNSLETIFEGTYTWNTISEIQFKNAKTDLNKAYFSKEYKIVFDVKTEKHEYKKKQQIVKKVFKATSYGFRENKSAHQALYRIKTTWSNDTMYFLDYDIKKTFSSINRNRLKSTFNRYVKDPRVWEEIEKMLNAGYIHNDMLQTHNTKVILNSILSPLLFNVYMHDFDQFMESLNKKHTIRNKDSKKLMNKYSNQMVKTYYALDSQAKFIPEKKKEFLEHDQKYRNKKNITLTNSRIQYIRYADDIIIGVVGSREFAIYAQKEINTYIKSNLHLQINRDEIIHRDQSPITFLGHHIQLINLHGKINTKRKQLEATHRYKNRAIQKLKSKEIRIAKLKTDKFRNEMLKHTSIMLNELNLTNNKKIDFLKSLSIYQSFGNILTKNLNLSSLKKLNEVLSLLDNNQKLTNSTLKKLSNIIHENVLNEQGLALININSEIKNLKHFSKVEKINLIIGEIQHKVKELSDPAITEFIINKSIESKTKHTEKQIQKITNPAINSLIKANLSKQSVRIISVKANITLLLNKLRLAGFMHPVKNQASSCRKLVLNSENKIIEYYNSLMLKILNWFSGADNFSRVKGIIESIIKRSCLLTLKKKFKLRNITEVINIYSTDSSLKSKNELSLKLISRKEIKKMPNIFDINKKPNTNAAIQQTHWELIASEKQVL